MALAGDVGCTFGPSLVGFVSGVFNDHLKTGLAVAIIFPLIIIFVISILKKQHNL